MKNQTVITNTQMGITATTYYTIKENNQRSYDSRTDKWRETPESETQYFLSIGKEGSSYTGERKIPVTAENGTILFRDAYASICAIENGVLTDVNICVCNFCLGNIGAYIVACETALRKLYDRQEPFNYYISVKRLVIMEEEFLNGLEFFQQVLKAFNPNVTFLDYSASGKVTMGGDSEPNADTEIAAKLTELGFNFISVTDRKVLIKVNVSLGISEEDLRWLM